MSEGGLQGRREGRDEGGRGADMEEGRGRRGGVSGREEGEERWLEGREGGEGKGGCEWRERE